MDPRQIPVCVCCVASVCHLTWGHGDHTHTLPKLCYYFFLRTSAHISGVGVDCPESAITTRRHLPFMQTPTSSIASPCVLSGGQDSQQQNNCQAHWIHAQIPVCVCCVASMCPLTLEHGGHTHTLPITQFFFFFTNISYFWCWCRLPRVRHHHTTSPTLNANSDRLYC